VTSKKSSLQKEERMQARKDPYRIRERDKVCIRMYVCLTDMFHHCKEKNNNMSTTKTRKKKKERTTNKIGNTKRTKKYVHQPRER